MPMFRTTRYWVPSFIRYQIKKRMLPIPPDRVYAINTKLAIGYFFSAFFCINYCMYEYYFRDYFQKSSQERTAIDEQMLVDQGITKGKLLDISYATGAKTTEFNFEEYGLATERHRKQKAWKPMAE